MNKLEEVKRTGFFPVNSLGDKSNYKQHYRIARDGSVTQCVFLNVPDLRLREEIICNHFLRHLVRHIFVETVGVNIVTRDEPWDFEIELSNGNHFNLEITSIADNIALFRNNKREESIDKVAHMETIPLRLFRKLYRDFPDDETQAVIDAADAEELRPEAEVENPWYGDGKRVLVSSMLEPDGSLFDLISKAISAKSKKTHYGKKRTTLIIDNRTSAFDATDFHKATKGFEKLRPDCPFKEVWFYTGYYSDDDGDNAECSLVPILVEDETLKRLQVALETMGAEPDDNGIVYGSF